MKKIALALAATSFASAPAFAGTYINAEVNNGYYGSQYLGRTVELHVGLDGSKEKFDYYVQGGPSLVAVEGLDGTETELSGKFGGNYNVSDRVALYGEFAGTTNGDFDNLYNLKAGAKYSF